MYEDILIIYAVLESRYSHKVCGTAAVEGDFTRQLSHCWPYCAHIDHTSLCNCYISQAMFRTFNLEHMRQLIQPDRGVLQILDLYLSKANCELTIYFASLFLTRP